MREKNMRLKLDSRVVIVTIMFTWLSSGVSRLNTIFCVYLSVCLMNIWVSELSKADHPAHRAQCREPHLLHQGPE